MATETLRPNAAGDLNQCYTNDGAGSSSSYTYIDETSPNDADYVRSVINTPVYDLYNLPSTAIPAGSTINNITLYGRFQKQHATYSGLGAFHYKTDGSSYSGSNLSLAISFGQFSLELTTNPKTSAAWTIDDINDLQIGVKLTSYLYSKDYYYACCSQLWVVVDYTEAAGSLPLFMHYYQKMMR